MMFKRYRLTEALTVPSGLIISLTDSQATARALCLRELGTDKFQVLEPIQLKAGEMVVVEIDGARS
jgi:hypothetical protein